MPNDKGSQTHATVLPISGSTSLTELTRVQTVCKGRHQTIKVAARKERVY